MRSRPDIPAICLCCVLLMAGSGAAGAPESATLPVATAAQPTIEQISAAMAQLEQDPNLGLERKQRFLKWKRAEQRRTQQDSDVPAWQQWILGFFDWMARSARVIVWVLAAALAAFVAIYVVRLLRARTATPRGDSFLAPSHVRDLDIRPESLPADIGAAALQLWQDGEQRRALALLYRGLLSRMVHAHRAPVRDSTTEGECIALARRCLPAASAVFATALVTTWQRAVYGELIPSTEQVQRLCREFSPMLDLTAPATAVPA